MSTMVCAATASVWARSGAWTGVAPSGQWGHEGDPELAVVAHRHHPRLEVHRHVARQKDTTVAGQKVTTGAIQTVEAETSIAGGHSRVQRGAGRDVERPLAHGGLCDRPQDRRGWDRCLGRGHGAHWPRRGRLEVLFPDRQHVGEPNRTRHRHRQSQGGTADRHSCASAPVTLPHLGLNRLDEGFGSRQIPWCPTESILNVLVLMITMGHRVFPVPRVQCHEGFPAPGRSANGQSTRCSRAPTQ